MKKFILLFAGILILASCSNESVVAEQEVLADEAVQNPDLFARDGIKVDVCHKNIVLSAVRAYWKSACQVAVDCVFILICQYCVAAHDIFPCRTRLLLRHHIVDKLPSVEYLRSVRSCRSRTLSGSNHVAFFSRRRFW